MCRRELFYYVTSGSNVMRDMHQCVTVFYQQIENINIANQIHGFTKVHFKVFFPLCVERLECFENYIIIYMTGQKIKYKKCCSDIEQTCTRRRKKKEKAISFTRIIDSKNTQAVSVSSRARLNQS